MTSVLFTVINLHLWFLARLALNIGSFKYHITADRRTPVSLLFIYTFQCTVTAFGSWNGRPWLLLTAFVYCHRQLGRHGSVSAAPPCGGCRCAPRLPVRRPVLPGPQGARCPHRAGNFHAGRRPGGADGSREAAGRRPAQDEAAGAGERGFPSGHALLQGETPHRGQSHLHSASEDAQRCVDVTVLWAASARHKVIC